MRDVIVSYSSAVWLLLAVLTGVSWYLGEQGSALSGLNAGGVTSVMMLIGFFKVRLVGLHFMELRYAPWPLRLAFEAWVVLVCVIILGLYWR